MPTKAWTYKHPRVIRWCHWLNVPLLSLMVWSGLLIYWANDEYAIHLGPLQLKFFPDWFYRVFHIDHHLATGMYWHFAIMWLFTINGLIYVTFLTLSGLWRDLWPKPRAFRDAIQVTLHDLRLTKKLPLQKKFNAAQQLAYTGIVFTGLGSILTGLAIYKPVQLSTLTRELGGYEAARLEHFILMLGYVFFVLVHVAQVVRAGWNNFRAMVMGYEAPK